MSDVIVSCACGWKTKADIPTGIHEKFRERILETLNVALEKHVLKCPKAGIKKIMLVPPPHFKTGLKYKEALQECADRTGIPVQFAGMLGGIMLYGSPPDVDAFLLQIGSPEVSG